MDQIKIYFILFGIIVVVGQIFNKTLLPISLMLVITGMVLSAFPEFPTLSINPALVLNVLLPLLIYQISAFSSWKDLKKNYIPITLLSVGHVIFITVLVAVIMHQLITQLSWPLAFILGAVVSPPDDVAIVSIAEKIRMPSKVVTILEGEGMLNDATALIIFRFALIALVTHEFFIWQASAHFLAIIIGETLYGLIIGYGFGEIRLKISNPILHMLVSLLMPFIAYLPPESLGGSGVLATAVTGFVIGHRYAIYFTPEFRLFNRALWPMISFCIQSILFLWVGLDMRSILENISSLSTNSLILYSIAIVFTVIIGRFIWVYVVVSYLPRLFSNKKKKLQWQYPFIVSWAGMRGAISLAAALAVPILPISVEGVNAKDLLVFLVFCVIAVTFVLQGLTLPWLLNMIGMKKYGQKEKYNEHLAELDARLQIIKVVLRWLLDYKARIGEDDPFFHEVKLYIQEYKLLKSRLKERIANHQDEDTHDEEAELVHEIVIRTQLIDLERKEVLRLWRDEKINLTIRNKLLDQLDHGLKNLPN